MDLEGKVIRLESAEHSVKLKAFFETNGYDTRNLSFNIVGAYYGVNKGKVDVYYSYELDDYDLEIVQLPSETHPPTISSKGVMMEVSDSGNKWFKRNVIGRTESGKAVVLTEDCYVYSYNYCRDISQVREVSFDKVAELLGVDPKNLKITK